jgi:very-short-patch-repair endonuclease
MFYVAKKSIFLRAIELRNNMTKAEKILWEKLKKKEIFKARWKRQHPIDIFVVDFYCHKYKLAIEVDGEIHLNEEIQEHNEGRSYDIEKLGIKILRFTNKEVFDDIEFVKNRILHEINSLSPL